MIERVRTNQRMGCGHALPPKELDSATWAQAEETKDPAASGKSGKATASKHTRLLTLRHVFEQARVGDGDLRKVDSLIPHLWQSLVSLRAPADQPFLPNPAGFNDKRKLNWHQMAEHEAAVIRSTAGVSAKRTSRAACWRALSASLKKTAGVDEAVGDICSGMVVLYAPLQEQCWKLGVVCAVWRVAAKGGCRPTALPISLDLARCFRVAQFHAHPNAVEGTFRVGADSCTSVVPAYRCGLVLKADNMLLGIDGLHIQLGKREIEIVESAKKFTSWSKDPKADLRLNRKRKTNDGNEGVEDLNILDSEEEAEASKAAKKKTKLPKAASSSTPKPGLDELILSLGCLDRMHGRGFDVNGGCFFSHRNSVL